MALRVTNAVVCKGREYPRPQHKVMAGGDLIAKNDIQGA